MWSCRTDIVSVIIACRSCLLHRRMFLLRDHCSSVSWEAARWAGSSVKFQGRWTTTILLLLPFYSHYTGQLGGILLEQSFTACMPLPWKVLENQCEKSPEHYLTVTWHLIKLCCLVTAAQGCEQLTQSYPAAALWGDDGLSTDWRCVSQLPVLHPAQ